jgi:hypothetical protein
MSQTMTLSPTSTHTQACGCRKPGSPGQMLCKAPPASSAGRVGLGSSGRAMIFGLWA